MNPHEAERIAAAIHQLRPDWPAASIRTLLGKPELTNRPRRDVAVALAWIACEVDTKTPARVLSAGPWWQAAGVEGGDIKPHERYDPRDVCRVCGTKSAFHSHPSLRDHAFLSVEAARAVPSTPAPDTLRAAIATGPGGHQPKEEADA